MGFVYLCIPRMSMLANHFNTQKIGFLTYPSTSGVIVAVALLLHISLLLGRHASSAHRGRPGTVTAVAGSGHAHVHTESRGCAVGTLRTARWHVRHLGCTRRRLNRTAVGHGTLSAAVLVDRGARGLETAKPGGHTGRIVVVHGRGAACHHALLVLHLLKSSGGSHRCGGSAIHLSLRDESGELLRDLQALTSRNTESHVVVVGGANVQWVIVLARARSKLATLLLCRLLRRLGLLLLLVLLLMLRRLARCRALPFTVVGVVGIVVGVLTSVIAVVAVASAASGQTNFIHQTLVTLTRLRLDADQDVLDILNNLSPDGLIEEGSGQNLEDERRTTCVVAEDRLQNLVVRSKEKSLKNSVPGISLRLLVDHLQDGQISDLMSAQMHEIGNELRRQNRAALRECAGIEEPSQEQGTVSVSGKLYTMEGNGSCEHPLLILGSVMTLQACPHGTSAVTALGNFPHLAEHGLKDEVIVGRAELQAALKDVVAILIEEQGDRVRAQVLNDEVQLLGLLADIDDLLSSPSTVLVYANLGHMRRNLSKHLIANGVRAVLKELLDNSVAEIIRRQLGNLRKHLDGNVLDLLLRQGLVIYPLADVAELGSVVNTGVGGLLDGRNLIDVVIELNGVLEVGRDLVLVLLSSAKLLDNVKDIGGHLRERWHSRGGVSGQGRWGNITSRASVAVLTIFLSLSKRIRARGRESSVVTGSVGSRRWLGKVDTNGTSTRENLLSVHVGLGVDGTVHSLKVDEAAVLVSQHSGRKNRTVRLEHLRKRGSRCGRGNAAEPQGACRALHVGLLGTEQAIVVAAVRSSQGHSSDSLGQILVLPLLRQLNVGGSNGSVKPRGRRNVITKNPLRRSVQNTGCPGTRTGRLERLYGEVMLLDSCVGGGKLILELSVLVLHYGQRIFIIIVFLVSVFILVVDRIRAEPVRRLGKINIGGHVGSGKLSARRLRCLCQAKVVQGPHMDVILAGAFAREVRLGGRAGVVGWYTGDAGESVAPFTTSRRPAAEDGNAEWRACAGYLGEGTALGQGTSSQPGEKCRSRALGLFNAGRGRLEWRV